MEVNLLVDCVCGGWFVGRQSVGRLACGETVSWNRAILVLSLGSKGK